VQVVCPKGTGDELLGEARVQLWPTFSAGSELSSAPLISKSGKVRGEISYRTSFTPAAAAAGQVRALAARLRLLLPPGLLLTAVCVLPARAEVSLLATRGARADVRDSSRSLGQPVPSSALPPPDPLQEAAEGKASGKVKEGYEPGPVGHAAAAVAAVGAAPASNPFAAPEKGSGKQGEPRQGQGCWSSSAWGWAEAWCWGTGRQLPPECSFWLHARPGAAARRALRHTAPAGLGGRRAWLLQQGPSSG
jgi:hypothetical protein